ncbi:MULTISPECIES: hypothetical protein [unclassified Streptomyces]|uniref:hypothetical protein n=1 Tax=unclassified Streptomyces TaxID=2593676 RepID=UPI002DDB60AB|nr:hypothetical protein [Streptomyces sp. NBC_01795]WSA92702.1 hypothetical protein OIE63_14865 [Streptomyces sp. NBC_01795]WSS43474.1 hypothetical protein OG220_24945 [Streptomyces sp. NBC_01187]
MSLPDRKETEVRRLLEQSLGKPVPVDLAERALTRGARLLRRRRVLRTALWLLLVVGLAVLVGWALAAQPWAQPPPDTSPTVGW